jgi:hypothetical protein
MKFLVDHLIGLVSASTHADGKPVLASPVRLRHHFVVASRPSTTNQFLNMLINNTCLRYSGKMMTSNLKRCDVGVIYYASKMLWKYPDEVLQFGFFQD